MYVCTGGFALVMLQRSLLHECSEQAAAVTQGEMIRSFWSASQEGSPLDRPSVHGSRERVQNLSAFVLRPGVEPGTVWRSEATYEPDFRGVA